MKTIKFPEVNQVFQKPPTMTDDECVALSVHNDGKQIISCWEMTAEEKIKAVFFGRVWLSVVGQSLPPVWLAVEKTVFINEEDSLDKNYLEKFKTRKIRQFLAKRYVPIDLDSGIYIAHSGEMTDLFLEFVNFLFEPQP